MSNSAVYRMAIFRILQTGILLLLAVPLLTAQAEFHKPMRRTQNQLDIIGPYLKTIYSFTPSYYDTLRQAGPDPLLIPRYQDKDIIPIVFDAVFKHRVTVYDPNFWGSVPQLIEKSRHEEFDTLDILNYLSAGWDTSLMIDNNGQMEVFPVYRGIPYNEISGIFFFESWWLDQKTYRIFKDVAAYLPIREYVTTLYDGFENMETRRRLLFMVIPQWSSGNREAIKYRPKDFRLIRKDIKYEIRLYNKPYDLYLYREENYGQISQAEFNEWQYHHFDFYRHFDADVFLEKIISGILDGKLHACLPGMPEIPLNREDFIKLLRSAHDMENLADWEKIRSGDTGISGLESEMLPEYYPISDLNSVIFHEDWYIHPGTLQIYKEVKAITINRTETRVDQYTGEFIQGSEVPRFTVWF